MAEPALMPRVAAVVLAAGSATRFGGGKLLASLDGRPVLQHALDRLAAAGIHDVVVVLGAGAAALETMIEWRDERRVRNPDPERGLSSSVRTGLDAIGPDVERVLFVLGDQPRVSVQVIRALTSAGEAEDRPITVPVYPDDGGRNPVLMHRSAFGLAAGLQGDRGFGPLLAAHPELVRHVEVAGQNPDVDTREDLVTLLEASWADRVRANNDQVERIREVPDGADYYAPVTSLFRADPTRTDEPALAALLELVEPGDTWLDIGAGAGRYALPIALALGPTGGQVIALDPSAAMLGALQEIADEHGIANVRTVQARWPTDGDGASGPQADIALIAHVGYDIAEIGPFLRAMEAAARRSCVAVLMERQPSSIADACWPPVWGESRVSLPALPELLELLDAMGRSPVVRRLEREPRSFESREALEGFLRRQLWVAEGGEADARFVKAVESMVVIDADGGARLRDQRPMPIGVVQWTPGGRDG